MSHVSADIAWPDGKFRVRLRNGTEALIQVAPTKPACGVFGLLGEHLREHWPHAWRLDGCWLETGAEHHLDIIEILPAYAAA